MRQTMKISVKVVPRAKKPGVERLADGSWRVAVSAPAESGKANTAVVDALAKHFDVPKSSIRILRGETSRLKLVEVPDPDFKEGVHLFNERRFFEAHEAWETLWHRMAAGPEREAMQGLIQLAAACHHLVRDNLKGARGCLENAHGHLGSSFGKLFGAIERAVEQGTPAALPKFENE